MKNNKRPRIVLDTNVWLSGLLFGGQPERVLRLFADNSVVVVISEELLSELRRIVAHKFSLYAPQLDLLEASIRESAELVKLGSHTINVSRDPDDNKVIETAIIGECSYIVSGDKDLLVLEKYQELKIMTPAEFMQIMN